MSFLFVQSVSRINNEAELVMFTMSQISQQNGSNQYTVMYNGSLTRPHRMALFSID